MPSKSKKQHNLMALVANDPKAAKRLGIPKSVGEEFMKADKTKKFGSGGALKEVDSSENPGLSKLPTEVRNKMGYMKKGGMAKGCATKSDAKMIAKKEVKGHESSMHKMKSGGKCYAAGGKASQLSKANGIAVRGKTKGKIC